MSLLDKFAMELADDLEKQSSSSNDNATINIKMDNIGESINLSVIVTDVFAMK